EQLRIGYNSWFKIGEKMKKLSLLVIFINLIWADGGIMPPQGDYEIYSSDQVAIIKILPDSEELSI
ncbi:unnamed protein product, partial [marine sediment metagenome]